MDGDGVRAAANHESRWYQPRDDEPSDALVRHDAGQIHSKWLDGSCRRHRYSRPFPRFADQENSARPDFSAEANSDRCLPRKTIAARLGQLHRSADRT